MREPTDLRRTYGWRLSGHARASARARGVDVREILDVIADPEISHTAEDYGPGRMVFKKGDLAVVGSTATKCVITVLWNTSREWTSDEFRAYRERQCA